MIWSKTVMLEACKIFGVNVSGFKLEVLYIIFRVDRRDRTIDG